MLNTPLRNRVTRGCWPTRVPSISSCVIEIADRMVLNVRYCFPILNCSNRNSRIRLTGAESGSVLCSKHQLSHCLHAHEYAVYVEVRHDFLIISITPSESPSVR